MTGAGWTPTQRRVVGICTFINGLDGMDVLIMSYVAPAMAADWGVGFGMMGLTFSAGLAGMVLGCLAVAPFADTVGRRPVVLMALAMMTAGMIGTGLAPGLTPFLVARVVAGIGIGTLLASIAALTAEYAPEGRQSFAIGLFQAGYPIGAVLTGLASIVAIPAIGWQATLLGAGLVSLATLPVAWFGLPESRRFLEGGARRAMPPVGALFADGGWRATIALWGATFAGFAVLYFVTSWIPGLAIKAGLAPGAALWAGTIFNLGGCVGATAIGWLAMRAPIAGLIRAFLIGAAALLVLFAAPMPLALVLVTAFGIGLTLQGGFSGFYALCATLYPAEIRSSGTGWAVGVGRGGAILGPALGGLLLAAKLPLWIVFGVFAVPLLVSGALAVLAARLRA
jgi:MFS family permease